MLVGAGSLALRQLRNSGELTWLRFLKIRTKSPNQLNRILILIQVKVPYDIVPMKIIRSLVIVSLLASFSAAQAQSSVLVPIVTGAVMSGDGGISVGQNTAFDPAYCYCDAFTAGHFSKSSNYQATVSWTITFTCTSNGQPTFNSGSYSFGDSEESDAWASLTGPSGNAEGYAYTPLTLAYDYEPGGPTFSPSTDTNTYSGSIPSLTWTYLGSNTWQGTYSFTSTTSYAYGVINRSYSGSSGDGGEGDTSIQMSVNYIYMSVTTH